MVDQVVTVAVHGPVYGYPGLPVFDGPGFDDQGPEVPYANRLKVDVPVTAATKLGEIIDTTAAQLGTTWKHGGRVSEQLTGIVFYEPEDEVAFKWRQQPWPEGIRLPDAAGNPSWRISWVETRFDELLAASEAGLVQGDPYRPYFWPIIPQGETLQLFHQSLWTLWLRWEHILAAYGTVGLGRRLLGRVCRGKEVAHAGAGIPWSHRLARPHDLFAYLAAAPRNTSEVASMLGCVPEQADAVLWAIGFVCGGDGLWRPADDAPARALYESVLQIGVLGRTPDEAELVQIADAAMTDDVSETSLG